jgi:hypothetical protein
LSDEQSTELTEDRGLIEDIGWPWAEAYRGDHMYRKLHRGKVDKLQRLTEQKEVNSEQRLTDERG